MILVVLSTLVSGAQSHFYVKELVFPSDADSITKIEMASRLVPSEKQLNWQNLELTAFLHFGVNTFTDREWGDGTESPSIFNPTDFDADQWIKLLSEAGFKLAIITAKHHDGFCLWPTSTTQHSLAYSPWRDGTGDVVREVAEACRKYGVKFGFYLSPWDRNAPCYGSGDEYNDMYAAQLTELLTNYGEVDEIWFDGACGEGPNGKKQEYDWQRFKSVVENLQPDAVTAIMGDDVRWVGNEAGKGRETEWCATAIAPEAYVGAVASNEKLGLKPKTPDLGSRELVAKADRLFWWPSEVDVSIRPGWFWHDNESPKSLRELAEIYLTSVGRNSVLLLNIPPDRAGKIDSRDSLRLMEFGKWIDDNFSNDLPLNDEVMINCIELREDISKGQRVEEFEVVAIIEDKEQILCSGTTIGRKRLLTFEPTKVKDVKVNVLKSRGEANLLPPKFYFITIPD